MDIAFETNLLLLFFISPKGVARYRTEAERKIENRDEKNRFSHVRPSVRPSVRLSVMSRQRLSNTIRATDSKFWIDTQSMCEENAIK